MSTHSSSQRVSRAALVAVVGQLVLAAFSVPAAYAADGVASDSGSGAGCSTGYYYCWSNVQQKSVCTTRKCY